LIADLLFLGWMNAFDQTQIRSVIELQWLTLDDDDADIGNGTPNLAEIDAAFVAQGFPGFNAAGISGVTLLADTQDQAGPYAVSATIVASAPPIASATLHWRVNGGGFHALAMSPQGGNTWAAAIPGQVAPALVEYYVAALDSGANILLSPAGAPSETYDFAVADLIPVLFDELESDQGWSVGNDPGLTTGAWERVDPLGTSAQPDDDFGAGSLCYVTQNGTGGSVGEADVDGGPTVLTTPSFAMAEDGRISYAYWAFNDDGDDTLVVEVSNDGGSGWVTVTSYPCAGGGWEQDDFLVSEHVAPTANMRVRFSIADDPNNSIGALCEPIRYCTPASPNQTGRSAQLDWSGSTSVAANDLVFTVGPLVAGNNGLIAYSPDVESFPLGNGTLCLGTQTLGFVLRLPAHAVTGPTMTHPLDISSPPLPIGQITAGSTWNFQSWNRDFTPGGQGYNFSDALQITFCP
jgi:hypothetical protein